jgi:predicted dehydrogenase
MVSVIELMDYASNPAARNPAWLLESGSGGGWLGARGSHALDQLLWWLGPFDNVSATLTPDLRDAAGADDGYAIKFRTLSGVHGVIEQTGCAWTSGSFTFLTGTAGSMGCEFLVGTRGSGGGDFRTVWLANADGRHVVAVPPDLELPGGQDLAGPQISIEIQHYTQLCAAFAAAIRGADPPTPVPLPTFADGLLTMDVLDAVRHSAAHEGALTEVTKRRPGHYSPIR